jgi:hypothetical protein
MTFSILQYLKTNTKARYQGYTYFFREGFCWSLINGTRSENDLKFRLSNIGVYDVGGMSMHSVLEKFVSQKFIVCIGNSKLINKYTEVFVNFTVNFQINDARKIPVVIPKIEQLNDFELIFNDAIKVKQKQFLNKITEIEAENELAQIQKKLDAKVYSLYGII